MAHEIKRKPIKRERVVVCYTYPDRYGSPKMLQVDFLVPIYYDTEMIIPKAKVLARRFANIDIDKATDWFIESRKLWTDDVATQF